MYCAPGLLHYEGLTFHRAVVSVVQAAFSKRLVERFMERHVYRRITRLLQPHEHIVHPLSLFNESAHRESGSSLRQVIERLR